jgi:hypothetical protein
MPLDSVSGQHWFDLFDKEEFTAVAVDTTLVALSGLTIVPSAASQVSLGWEHIARAGNGCWTPLGTSLQVSRPRGGVSVALALTEAPSLSSFSPFSMVSDKLVELKAPCSKVLRYVDYEC